MICVLHLCCSTSRIGVGQRFGRRSGAGDCLVAAVLCVPVLARADRCARAWISQDLADLFGRARLAAGMRRKWGTHAELAPPVLDL